MNRVEVIFEDLIKVIVELQDKIPVAEGLTDISQAIDELAVRHYQLKSEINWLLLQSELADGDEAARISKRLESLYTKLVEVAASKFSLEQDLSLIKGGLQSFLTDYKVRLEEVKKRTGEKIQSSSRS